MTSLYYKVINFPNSGIDSVWKYHVQHQQPAWLSWTLLSQQLVPQEFNEVKVRTASRAFYLFYSQGLEVVSGILPTVGARAAILEDS